MKPIPDKTSRRKHGGLSALLSSALLCAVAAFFGAAPAARGSNYVIVEGMVRCGYQQQVATLINQYRTAHGISTAGVSERLTDNAMVRAAELSYKYCLTPRPNGWGADTVVPYRKTGDLIIAKDYTTPAAVVNAWLNSGADELAILDRFYTHIGVGCFVRNGTYYWCVIFCDNPGGNPPAVETRKDDYDATVGITLVTSPESYITLAERAKYKVKFSANGGKGKMSTQTIARDKSVALRKNAFKRSGYVFIGWAKKKSGSVAYKNGAKVKNLAAKGKTTTLYAKWAKKNYKVKFYANGGKGKMSAQKMTYGKSAKLRANKFTRKGYTFQGWAKSKKGKVVYKNKKSVKNLVKNGKTVKLYAKWKKKSSSAKYITVKFDPNGGTGSMPTMKYKVGKVERTPKNAFTRSGYYFVGWYEPVTDTFWENQFRILTVETYNNGCTSVTFYARWVKAKSKSPNTPSEAAAAGATVPSLPTAAEPWVVATTSDGSDGTAVVDGDETTAWSPETADGSWVVLSFEDMLDVSDVEVLGENLPEGTRILFSQDADDWTEDLPCVARYVWVAFPEADLPPIVKEIRVEEE